MKEAFCPLADREEFENLKNYTRNGRRAFKQVEEMHSNIGQIVENTKYLSSLNLISKSMITLNLMTVFVFGAIIFAVIFERSEKEVMVGVNGLQIKRQTIEGYKNEP